MECAGSPLDWSPGRAGHVDERPDSRIAHSGKSSYRIHFDGATNLDYHGVSQITPGIYHFQSWIKAPGITTNQGLPSALWMWNRRKDWIHTSPLTGEVDWMKPELTFHAPPATRAVQVELVRRPSWKFDNRIAGTALDRFGSAMERESSTSVEAAASATRDRESPDLTADRLISSPPRPPCRRAA